MMKTFSHVFGLTLEGFRAPWYQHNQNTYQAIDNPGLKYDCSKKQMEIAFKRIPFYEKRYMYTKTYSFAKPFLKLIGSAYNMYANLPDTHIYHTECVRISNTGHQ